jgi:hypothetical protein
MRIFGKKARPVTVVSKINKSTKQHPRVECTTSDSSDSADVALMFSKHKARISMAPNSICGGTGGDSFDMNSPWCSGGQNVLLVHQGTAFQLVPKRGILKHKSGDSVSLTQPDGNMYTYNDNLMEDTVSDPNQHETRNSSVRFKDDVIIYSEARLRSEGASSHFDKNGGSDDENSVDSTSASNISLYYYISFSLWHFGDLTQLHYAE